MSLIGERSGVGHFVRGLTLCLVIGLVGGCGKAGPDASVPDIIEPPRAELAALKKAVDDALQNGTMEAMESAATLVGENLSALKESNPDKQQTVDQLAGLLAQVTGADELPQRTRALQAVKARLAELK